VGESTHLLQNREVSEYPVGESTHLLQNRGICDIRIDYFFIRMVLQKRKISQNILQDIGGGPT
jgi:hypothetical protein